MSGLRDAAVFVVCLACAFAAASIDDPAPAVALAPVVASQRRIPCPPPVGALATPFL